MKKKLTDLQKSILDCLKQGMNTKDIMAQLNCSESSIKHIRTNEKLNKIYDETDVKSNYEAVKKAIPKMMDVINKVIENPNSSFDQIMTASNKLIELSKLNETIFPESKDIKVEIVYVKPEDRRHEILGCEKIGQDSL